MKLKYFVPSQQKDIVFNFLTVKQVYDIQNYNNLKPNLNIGLSCGLAKTLLNNCNENLPLTDFDKHALYIQIYYHEILRDKEYIFTKIEHPAEQNIVDSLYNINLTIPALKEEIGFCNYCIITSNTNLILLAEIAKYIDSLSINKTQFNLYSTTFSDKVDIISKIPIDILAKCVEYIDQSKKKIKSLYEQNNIKSLFNISLLEQ